MSVRERLYARCSHHFHPGVFFTTTDPNLLLVKPSAACATL